MTELTRLTAKLEKRLKAFSDSLGSQDAAAILERLTDMELFGADMSALSTSSQGVYP
jgi:hypothetical protein